MPGKTTILARSSEFLAGGGQMGALIRSHDWASTPLGTPETWPQSLRTVVRLMLSSNHPMFIFWGRDLICLYNDAYSASIGPEKHPAMLGARGREMWREIWEIIGPQIEKVMSGAGATWHEDALVPINRHGRLEDVYWTYGYSPIDDERAPLGVGGVLVVCTETTEKVLTTRRLQLQVHFDDVTRDISDPSTIIHESVKLLGRYLRASGCGYIETDDNGARIKVGGLWSDDDTDDNEAHIPFNELDDGLLEELRAGRAVHWCGDGTDAEIPKLSAWPAAMKKIPAALVTPILNDGKLAAFVYVCQTEPRNWTKHERILVSQVSARIWTAVTHARVEDDRARLAALVAASQEFIGIADLDGHALFVNDAGRALVGLPDLDAVRSTKIPDYFPSEELKFLQEEVMPTVRKEGFWEGELHFKNFETGRVIPVRYNIFPVKDAAGSVVAYGTVTWDLTEKKRQQEHQEMLVNELSHRVKNTLATVQSMALQTFRSTKNIRDAKKLFEGRLLALASAHDLITRDGWGDTRLSDIVSKALAPFGDAHKERLKITGPDISVTPKFSIALTMALHELGTNSVKYGALSNSSGFVEIEWCVVGPPKESRLYLRWTEVAGPPVEPPRRKGFGTRLIETGLSHDLNGRAEIQYLPDGVVCIVEASLSNGDDI